jgi:nucleoside-triphosphatase THEP1
VVCDRRRCGDGFDGVLRVLPCRPPKKTTSKTTLAVRLVGLLQAARMPVAGFVTREIREEGARMEVELETLDGRRGRLAHVDLRGGPRVGRYGVALDELERLAVPALAAADDTIVVVDELGKWSSPPRASVTPSPAC